MEEHWEGQDDGSSLKRFPLESSRASLVDQAGERVRERLKETDLVFVQQALSDEREARMRDLVALQRALERINLLEAEVAVLRGAGRRSPHRSPQSQGSPPSSWERLGTQQRAPPQAQQQHPQAHTPPSPPYYPTSAAASPPSPLYYTPQSALLDRYSPGHIGGRGTPDGAARPRYYAQGPEQQPPETAEQGPQDRGRQRGYGEGVEEAQMRASTPQPPLGSPVENAAAAAGHFAAHAARARPFSAAAAPLHTSADYGPLWLPSSAAAAAAAAGARSHVDPPPSQQQPQQQPSPRPLLPLGAYLADAVDPSEVFRHLDHEPAAVRAAAFRRPAATAATEAQQQRSTQQKHPQQWPSPTAGEASSYYAAAGDYARGAPPPPPPHPHPLSMPPFDQRYEYQHRYQQQRPPVPSAPSAPRSQSPAYIPPAPASPPPSHPSREPPQARSPPTPSPTPWHEWPTQQPQQQQQQAPHPIFPLAAYLESPDPGAAAVAGHTPGGFPYESGQPLGAPRDEPVHYYDPSEQRRQQGEQQQSSSARTNSQQHGGYGDGGYRGGGDWDGNGDGYGGGGEDDVGPASWRSGQSFKDSQQHQRFVSGGAHEPEQQHPTERDGGGAAAFQGQGGRGFSPESTAMYFEPPPPPLGGSKQLIHAPSFGFDTRGTPEHPADGARTPHYPSPLFSPSLRGAGGSGGGRGGSAAAMAGFSSPGSGRRGQSFRELKWRIESQLSEAAENVDAAMSVLFRDKATAAGNPAAGGSDTRDPQVQFGRVIVPPELYATTPLHREQEEAPPPPQQPHAGYFY